MANVFRWAVGLGYFSVIMFSVPMGIWFWAGSVGEPQIQSTLNATIFYWAVTGLSAVSVRLWECFSS